MFLSLDCAEFLLQHGADVNVISICLRDPTRIRVNALYYAVCHGNIDVIAPLVKYGIDVNFIAGGRYSALHEAVMRGKYMCILRQVC
jgi:hypothetical protein